LDAAILVGRALIGEDLEYRRDIVIEIEDGFISSIRYGVQSCGRCVNRSRFTAIPILVNTHIHLFDSAFPEIGGGLSLREAVKPGAGLKHRMLSATPRRRLVEEARRTLRYLASTGVGIIGDFREGGINGCRLGLEAARGTGIVYAGLCRPSPDLSDLDPILSEAWGLGVPSPLAYPEETLRVMRREASRRGRLIHVHVSEDPADHEAEDYRLAVEELGADVLVHATNMNPREIETVAERIMGMVLCPRSNAWWSVGQPLIVTMMKLNIPVALGTDNVAWIKPDMWREMEAAFNLARLQQPGFNDARLILKAATLNGARLLGMSDRGVIEEGYRADFVLLDPSHMALELSSDPVASIVKRGGPEAVVETYVEGKPIYSEVR